ncbi:hypothetical protein CYLTODRAFT_488269 [Cylindrobasidium torrendii FP15055 ss-10]|uniref:Uncharacterized protein n=1 Tax=Cylindrobasidium torrendii FP15055 ss-10 TaxID=1314674 RepID=A0A0D7BJG1_9AGAR|nr:hypothetical protein CYLTODRAFT_488269 [Cylindrobasidium torrendii FP15055 ss-10]
MLFRSLWAHASHLDLHGAVSAPPIHERSAFTKKFKVHERAKNNNAPMKMRKGLFVIGMSMMVYSGGTSQSLEFYKQLAFQRCVRHAKRVDQRLYYATDFADFQKTVAYFAKLAVPVYTRMRPWVHLPGMSSHAETAERFLAISRLVGDAQRRAHGILHRACREVHSMVRDFDEKDAGPEDGLRWDSVAPRLVFFLIDEVAEALGEPAPEYGIHSLRSTPSRGTPLATLTETDTEEY